MFTTTAKLKQDVGAYGLSFTIDKAGSEVLVEKSEDVPDLRDTPYWRIVGGNGGIIHEELLDFDL